MRCPSHARSRSRATALRAAWARTRSHCRLPRSSTSADAASCRGSPTRTSHFPTWSLGQKDLALDGVGSLADALERVRGATPRAGWIRGLGWRSAGWDAEPTKEALDEVTGETPAALWAKDLHSLWLNSAALALAEGDLEVDGGVVERDGHGEPTGVLREESAWHFRDRFPAVSDDEWLEAREPASGSRTRAVSPRSTTRTAGSARPASFSD